MALIRLSSLKSRFSARLQLCRYGAQASEQINNLKRLWLLHFPCQAAGRNPKYPQACEGKRHGSASSGSSAAPQVRTSDVGVPGVGSIFVSVVLTLIFLRGLNLRWAPGAGAGGWRCLGTCGDVAVPRAPLQALPPPDPSVSPAAVSPPGEASDHFAWR